MYSGRTVFSQVMDYFPTQRFRTCVARYAGNARVRKFSCHDHFLVLAFAQLTYRESLRDIETCLHAMRGKLYHIGIRHCVPRNTLAKANELRDWRIFADTAQILIPHARSLYIDEDFSQELQDATLYALDASTIDLCLSLFPWAKFRQTKAAVKLHTLMDLRGNIPVFLHISDGKLHDVNLLDLLVPEPGAYYIMDRGYLDFSRLFSMDQIGSFFITRAKKNFKFTRRYSRPVRKDQGVQCDQIITLSNPHSYDAYPKEMRRIRYMDPESGKRLVFLTNNFGLDAETVSLLYKSRWQIELFFKWIKQHLRIKTFYGTSQNAVKVQIWSAVVTYLLVAILKKELGLEQSLYTILQALSVTLFEKTPIKQLFSDAGYKNETRSSYNQLTLFDF